MVETDPASQALEYRKMFRLWFIDTTRSLSFVLAIFLRPNNAKHGRMPVLSKALS